MLRHLKPKKILPPLIAAGILSLGFLLSGKISTPDLPQQGEAPLLYSNQTRDDLKQLYLHAIDQAEKSVDLIIYSLRDPQLIRALRQKSDEGISVTVLCDGKASRGVNKKLGPKVQTRYWNEKGILHQKILVIDSRLLFLGSANFTSESLRMHGNLVLGLHHPEMAQWILAHNSDAAAHETFQAGEQQIELWMTRDNPQAANRVRQLIAAAQKTARVAMFTWTRQDFAETLADASDRGIATELILDRNASRGSGRKVVGILKERGLAPKMNSGNGLLHHKMLWIDESTLLNGSANWTKAAFSHNQDCFIILHSLREPQKKKLQKLWRVLALESRPIPD